MRNVQLILEAKENLLDIWMHGQLLIDFVEDCSWKENRVQFKCIRYCMMWTFVMSWLVAVLVIEL